MRRGFDPVVNLTIGGLSNARRLELNQRNTIFFGGRGAFGELSLLDRNRTTGFRRADGTAL
jgi:hypothetical protein